MIDKIQNSYIPNEWMTPDRIDWLLGLRDCSVPDGNNCPQCLEKLVATYHSRFVLPIFFDAKCPKCGWRMGYGEYVRKQYLAFLKLPSV